MSDDHATEEKGPQQSDEQAPGGRPPEEHGRAREDLVDDGSHEERPPTHDGRPLTDEERAEIYRRQLKELRVVDVARDMMLTVVTVGYQKLGLTEETRELRDLDDARLAIELLRAIIGAVDGVTDQAELESYRSTLAQMQLNYARAVSE